ncbi:putative D-xylose utilization operon transcriptional repressor [bacterium HR31]|uniref:GntR family transcriptional regulator n=1 Tax=uncultured prokaryote TaxID=198431 RepID=H5SKP8_9ZZZZ|nr:GntR family transcriptional regulator [uncultured prokaryote]GBD28803.1 putative D-xylose utilization operon transcriptional repressor [bacterium HR31]
MANRTSGRRQVAASRAVYEWVVAAIRSGRLRPGDPLREEQLARQLRCSRTPVREALQRLRAEGYLERGRRRGLAVAEPTQEELLDLCVVRETLEGLAARLAARGITTSEVYFLEELCEDMERALRQDDLHALARLNAEFHAVIWRAARNRYLARELQRIWLLITRQPVTTLSYPGRAREALAEHRALLDAIRVGDADRAEQLARQHMAKAQMIRMRIAAGHTLGQPGVPVPAVGHPEP